MDEYPGNLGSRIAERRRYENKEESYKICQMGDWHSGFSDALYVYRLC